MRVMSHSEGFLGIGGGINGGGGPRRGRQPPADEPMSLELSGACRGSLGRPEGRKDQISILFALIEF